MHTCYSPVRRSPADEASFIPAAPRLACVKPVASVHPEPGSNSPLFILSFYSSFFKKARRFFNVVCLKRAPLGCLPRPPNEPFYCVWTELTRSNFYLLLYCFVSIVSVFNVRCAFKRKRDAKLRTIFGTTKFLFNFLTLFKNFEVLYRFVPESECKVTPFFRILQIF